MKKTKAVSLLLSLSLLASLAIPGTLALPARAVDGQESNGLHVSKTATANGDGSYTITLEAYATGSKITTETKKDIPTDIILVLDQSGSMADRMSSAEGYSAYSNYLNQWLYYYRFNNSSSWMTHNLYYPTDDGGYVEVQVDIESVFVYEVPKQADNSTYYGRDNRSNLYIKDADGSYVKVSVERTGNSSNRRYTYTYTYNGVQQTVTSTGADTRPDFGDHGPLYVADTDYAYTYYYQLAGQERVTIEVSTGADTVPNETYYQYGTINTTRLEALQQAVNAFSESVKTKAAGEDGVLGTDDDVNHRVAVVGFASQSGYGNNTELLSISGRNSGSVGVAYNNITNQNLKDVLQDMDTEAGQSMVDSAISALAAEGATQADLGMDMANWILNANPVREGEQRTRVVVFFTDGSPTSGSYFEESVANAAISSANTIKNGGVTVYSVGIFPGADATSNGIASGNSSRRENQFMQDVSSNNGTPRNPSYYLSASDSATLNGIFQQISDQIQEGGSSSTLDESAVIRDIIAPSFTLPVGADENNITLETYQYIGEETWQENNDNMGAAATVVGDQVSVTGFDFSENWCGTETAADGSITYRGNKLVISFTVQPKEGFLGGNNVPTNTSAGVYENGEATEPMATFPVPAVNVPIQTVTVTAEDKNVYLLGGVTRDQLLENATAAVGTVPLDLDAENYGLAEWQYAYVNLGLTVYDDEDDNEIEIGEQGFTNMVNDGKYGILLTVTPKEASQESSGAAATAMGGRDARVINVFKPELTYKDGEAWYGDTVPNDFTENLEAEKWVHTYWPSGSTESVSVYSTDEGVTMLGDKPTLSMTYTPDAGKLLDNKINTKQDVPVDVTVKVEDTDVTLHTAFQHTDCDGKTCELPENYEFLLHVKTCQLTVTKSGGAAVEPYVFTVYRDGKAYSEVTIVGNTSETIYELPVGTYTIDEDEGWSWRYNGAEGAGVVLSKTSPGGTVTCTNTQDQFYWLNGFSEVVKNIFGSKD